MFTSFQWQTISDRTFIETIDYHDRIESTNTRALELANHSITRPVLVIAREQTGGRGRGTNRWWSQDGALTFSLLLELPPTLQSTTPMSLVAGLAVCEAVQRVDGTLPLWVKWPNDVMVRQRKLCGILVEAVTTSNHVQSVIGIGVNVNNSLKDAPADLQTIGTSLRDEVGRLFDPVDTLVGILQWLQSLLEEPDSWRARWNEYCGLTGKLVEVQHPDGNVVAGVCQGIDDRGGLVLQHETGSTSCVSGTVVRYEG